MLGLQRCLFNFGFPTKILYEFLTCPIYDLFPSQFVLLDLTTWKHFKNSIHYITSSSYYLYPSITSFLLDINKLLSILSWNVSVWKNVRFRDVAPWHWTVIYRIFGEIKFPHLQEGISKWGPFYKKKFRTVQKNRQNLSLKSVYVFGQESWR